MAAPTPAPSHEHWGRLAERIRAGETDAVEELYQYFSRGVRLLLYRQLGPENLDDRVHDVFLVVLEAIQSGALREPDRLPGYIRTVVRRQTASAIAGAVEARREFLDVEQQWGLADEAHNPEQQAIYAERVLLIRRTLADMNSRDREILTRFYLYEQTQEEICAEMGINETQFRLLKSRAKARFGESGRRRVLTQHLRGFILRKIVSA